MSAPDTEPFKVPDPVPDEMYCRHCDKVPDAGDEMLAEHFEIWPRTRYFCDQWCFEHYHDDA